MNEEDTIAQTNQGERAGGPGKLGSYLLMAAMALVFGFLGAAAWNWSGLGNDQLRQYLIANPDILPQMADAYQKQQASTQLSGLRAQVEQPFSGAILGNPEGSKVLVEFSDYNCPYCRQSMADVEKLIAADPQVKLVVREWPIFEGSEQAARMALAAARQGRFAQFHAAMFEHAPTTPEAIEQAARDAGLDLERARKEAQGEDISQELARNHALAQQIGFTGTPSWVVGEEAFEGAVGFDRLRQALEPKGQ